MTNMHELAHQALLKKYGGEEGFKEHMKGIALKSHQTQRDNIRVALSEALGRPVEEEEIDKAYRREMSRRGLVRKKRDVL